MKRILVVLACLAFASCASAPSSKGLAKFMPFAVVTVYSNAGIGWDTDKSETKGLLNKAIGKVLADKDDDKLSTLLSRADTLVDVADGKILATLSASGVALVPKEKLFPAAAYKAAEESKLKPEDIVLPAEYRYLDMGSKALGDIAKETGANSVAFIMIKFDKAMANGAGKTGSMLAAVTITMQVQNPKNGRVVFTGTYFGQSKQNTPVAGGIYDPRELMKLFPEAIDEACAKLAKSLNS